MNCQLHFACYSWKENWEPQGCPECGLGGNFIHWRESSRQQVFEFVPGTGKYVTLVGMEQK